MFQHSRVRPRLAASTFLIAALAVSACSGTTPTARPTTAATVAPPSTSAPASEAPAGTPAATELIQMGINPLPEASIDPSTVDVICEDATGGAMSCDDIVVLTARIAATISAAAPTKIDVVRDADPNIIDVTFVAPGEEDAGDLTFTSTINLADQTITFPAQAE